jgi:hypothetical protein
MWLPRGGCIPAMPVRRLAGMLESFESVSHDKRMNGVADNYPFHARLLRQSGGLPFKSLRACWVGRSARSYAECVRALSPSRRAIFAAR